MLVRMWNDEASFTHHKRDCELAQPPYDWALVPLLPPSYPTPRNILSQIPAPEVVYMTAHHGVVHSNKKIKTK